MNIKGGRLPLWAWIAGPALILLAVVVIIALLRQGEEPAGEIDEPGPPAVYTSERDDVAPGVSMYQIAENPQEYYGSTVTVTGEASYVLGPNALLVVPRFGVSADDTLVISPVALSEVTGQSDDAPLSQGDTVQITGEVREFEPPSIEQEIGVDLDDESLAAYDGMPSIVASSISLDPPVSEEGQCVSYQGQGVTSLA
jgi:hypothetical protein